MFEISNIASGEEIVKSTLFCKVFYVLCSDVNSYNIQVIQSPVPFGVYCKYMS
jgi:hypothetical protein